MAKHNKHKKHNHFVTALLILGVISILTVLYYLLPKRQNAEIFVVGTESGTVNLALTPSSLDSLPNVESTLTLSIDAGNSHATAAQIELDYDASKIGTPIITQGDFFPTVISAVTLDNNKIKFTYSSEVAANSAKTGSGTLATIKINPITAGTSTLSFTENTMISTTESQINSLKTVTNATINITNSLPDGSPTSSPTSSPTTAKPAKPTGLRSNCYDDGTKITLRWDSVSGASSYKVRMDQKNGDKDISVDNIKDTQYNALITPDTQYSWWVHSVKDGLDSEEAKINEVICPKPVTTSTQQTTTKTVSKIVSKLTKKTTPPPTPTPTSTPQTLDTYPTHSTKVDDVGSLNDIFGETPIDTTSQEIAKTGFFTKVVLGWQVIFFKIAALFQ